METKDKLTQPAQPDTQEMYEAPIVRNVSVIVERGFAISNPWGDDPTW